MMAAAPRSPTVFLELMTVNKVRQFRALSKSRLLLRTQPLVARENWRRAPFHTDAGSTGPPVARRARARVVKGTGSRATASTQRGWQGPQLIAGGRRGQSRLNENQQS